MWRNHPFSQRNEATKSAFGLEVGGEVGVLDKICEWGVGNRGGVFIK